METTHVRCTGVEAHDLPSGGSVYVYVLELRLRDGSVLRSRQRYSSWRAIHRAVRDVKGRTSPLPPFPDKNNWTRQTPTFLAARGKAIEQYIAAVLADPILAELPEVLALRSPAPPPLLSAQSTIGGSMTTMLDAATSSTTASPAAPAPSPSARAQRPQTAATASGVAATPPKATRPATTTPGMPLHGSSPAPRPTTALAPPVSSSSSSSSSEALAWADLLLPLLALVLALVAGAALSAPALAGSSCILGLGAGRLYRLSVAAPAAEAELYSEASDLSSTTAVASPATLRTAAAPPAAQSAAGGGGGGGGGGGATTSGASRGGAGGSNLSREMAAFAAPTIAARAAASSAQAPDGVV